MPRSEKRFSVAAFQRDFVLSQPVALVRQDGEAVAFATVMMTDLRDEVTVGLMRYEPDKAPRYAMEYLFIRLIQYFREQGYRSFSLGTVPLSGFRAHRLAPRWHRLGRVIWLLGRRFYNFQGLRTFKGKFDPAWEPRYLAASGWFGPYIALIDIAALIGGGMRAAIGHHAVVGNGAVAASPRPSLRSLPPPHSCPTDRPGHSKPAISTRCIWSIPSAQCAASSCSYPTLAAGVQYRMMPPQRSRAMAR